MRSTFTRILLAAAQRFCTGPRRGAALLSLGLLATLALPSRVPVPDTAGATVSPESLPASCPDRFLRRVDVGTAAELIPALQHAQPGDLIVLADGVYTGHFVAAVAGTATAPITLCGTRGAVLDGGGLKTGYGLYLQAASYWTLAGFTVRNARKGIMLDGASHNLLRDLEVYQIGEEGVHFRAFSTDNLLLQSTIHDVGLYTASYGEGVYIGSAYANWPMYSGGQPDRSDRNQVIGNTLRHTTAESIDVKEGTIGGLIQGNTFLGAGMTAATAWVNVKGNDYIIRENVGQGSPVDGFQTNVVLKGWGNRNAFHVNTADVQGIGYGIRIRTSGTGNVVGCDNQVTNAALGFANVPCQ